MDYEKEYKAALGRARNLHKDAIDMEDSLRAKMAEIIFPELKESEDERRRNERIRKDLITFLDDIFLLGKNANFDKWRKADCSTWIAWLEKQESVNEIVSRCKDSWYNEGKIQGMAEGLSDDEKYQQGWHDAIEKQGDKKHSKDEIDKAYVEFTKAAIEYFYGEDNPMRQGLVAWLNSLTVNH